MLNSISIFILWFGSMCIAAILSVVVSNSKVVPAPHIIGYQPVSKYPDLEPLSPPKEP